MRTQQLLTVLLVILAAAAITAFVITVTRDDGDQDPPTPHDTIPATETHYPAAPSTPRAEPPTTDLLGNRLEVPDSPAGEVLPPRAAPELSPSHPDYLTAAPTGLQWQQGWGGAALPISASDGPTRIHDGIATGFARTPRGAALAALDALSRALSAPDGTWQRVMQARYYGDTGQLQDRFARARANTTNPGRYVTVPDGVRVQPGYRDDFAVVEIATRTDGGYAIATWPVAWIDNDWRVRIPEDIETLWRPGRQIQSIADFGSWRER